MQPLHNPLFVKFIVYFNEIKIILNAMKYLRNIGSHFPIVRKIIHLRHISYFQRACTTFEEAIRMGHFEHFKKHMQK